VTLPHWVTPTLATPLFLLLEWNEDQVEETEADKRASQAYVTNSSNEQTTCRRLR
jgi:hypothetical protein